MGSTIKRLLGLGRETWTIPDGWMRGLWGRHNILDRKKCKEVIIPHAHTFKSIASFFFFLIKETTLNGKSGWWGKKWWWKGNLKNNNKKENKKRKHADAEGERWGWMIYYFSLLLLGLFLWCPKMCILKVSSCSCCCGVGPLTRRRRRGAGGEKM